MDALSLDLDKVFFCYVKIMGPGIPGELLHFVGLYTILGPYIQFRLSEIALYGPVRCCTVLYGAVQSCTVLQSGGSPEINLAQNN